MNTTIEEQQYKKMTEYPVKPLIIKLAIPTIISMLITSVYSIADTYFVSQLGKSASGAVGVVFSLMAVIQAVGFTLGMGGGSIISRALGVKNNKRANETASTSFFTALLIGLIITVAGSIFKNSLVRVLGATETVLPYAKEYATYILFGAPIMAGSFVLNNVLRAEGKATFSMIGLTCGGILNICLDPLFIMAFKMGIAGAAVATLISQVVSFTILLVYFIADKSIVKIKPSNISKEKKLYSEIVKTGLPSFCRQGFASVSTIILNNQAALYGGDAALSAMSIVSKIFMVIFCVGLGVGQGFQPVMGYNYSSERWKRVKEAFCFTYCVITASMTVFAVLAFILAPYLIPMFIKDNEVIEIGVRALRFQALSMPFLSMNVICNMTFQSIGKKLKAVMLSCCRQGFFFIPTVLLLPFVFGITGVEATQATSDIITFIVSIPFAVSFLRSINSIIENDEIK